jgi:hypothetical protein
MSETRFQIACLELYNPKRHGRASKSLVEEKYLILHSYDIDEFYNKINDIKGDIEFANTNYHMMSLSHPTIRNYTNIIKNPKHLELRVIEPIKIYFGDGKEDYYSTGIDKTIWIKLIQRRWRNIQKKRIQSKIKIDSLKYRELHGKWPQECNIPFKLGL